ncbi:RHS repeat-associated core domain-containing protein [Streptomyces sp. B1866]|uniref:putative T7SS-secreted protein n=1 Tax=Streptomyces sp. B1866 TaxID=3075431 RepID=UPI00288CC2AB|nr:RHS repeat-associated core domain-containing protein [Streptomyces sp. B1866]MDT3395061.1 RHS repeat-associated core domain-containing protein [Streptomyces sp. B1866]
MGFGDFISDITPDSVENAIEDGTEWLGDRVEDAGNWTADRLEDVGWESGADWVREHSRSLANRMGAEVDEMDLGQTEDKDKLVYGSPGKIRSAASHLRDLQRAFDDVGGGLKGLDAESLRGRTADAFRESVSIQPPKWFRGADAFEKAAGALESFAGTVEWAQGQAQTAIDTWKAGTQASADARDAHKKKVDAYNSAVDTYNAKPADQRDPSSLPPRPGAFTDPGKAQMDEAQEILAEARRQRNTAAETARSAIRAARDTAPPKPSYAEQATDGLEELPVMYEHFQGGVIKGTAGLLTFVRGINPTDPYNLTHPAEYATNLNSTAAGLVQVANDPWGAGQRMVSEFMKDPSEGLGRLAPDVLLTVATGGAGAGARAARIAKEGADLAADANRARRLVDDAPRGTHDRPHGERTTTGTDPVDLASGRMFLPQTDVALPGDLPLVFTRRVESGYTAGRFFGPSWSSTVDERLEIDATGVVHVTADGLLLAYPHPAPGLPTWPLTGTCRRALARGPSGDYTVTDPDTGLVRHFSGPAGTPPGGDGEAWLAETADRNGHRITVDRTADGTPLALVHSAGHRLTVTAVGGRITALTLGTGPGAHILMTYGYRGGDLTAVTKPSGATLAFTYDDRHRVTSWTDSNGRRYAYAYDDRDRVVAEGGEAGHLQLTLDYGAPDPATGHRVTTLTTAAGHATRHLIGDGCRVLATTDPLGHTTRFTYDARGNRLSGTDPLGRTTAYGYDGDGRLTAVTRPDGAELRAERDEAGRITAFTGPDGAVWRQEYDARGNRTAVTDPAGHTTRYAYDSRGRLTSLTDPLGAVTRVRCDAAGLPAEVTDPLGAVTRYDRDAFGRPVRVTDPLGAATTLQWTADGDLARRTAPDGAAESWTYDGEGNRTAHTDAAGHTTRFEYTHFDLLAARTDPDGTRHEFTHDAGLRLTGVTNPQGLTWSYAYDPAGRLTSETDFDGRTTAYVRDPAGQLTARTTPLGETIGYEHDALGRLTRKDAAGRVSAYAYDPEGRLLRAEGPDGELVRQYDRVGRLKTELADGRATTYAYDAAGRRTRRTTPTGQVTTYTHDAAGRTTELTAGGRRIAFTHDATGRERERAIGDFLRLTSAWDAAGRLATHSLTAGDRVLNRRAYTYRADGALAALDDTLRGPARFALDPAGRVTEVTAEGWQETYAYDAAGNLTTATWPASHPGQEATGPRAYTGTAVTRAGGVRYEHDAAGRITLRQRTRLSRKPDTWRYEWDAEDRLTAVTTPDGTRWHYRYDPLGRRTAKQRLDAEGRVVEETRFTWDGTSLCEQTTTSPDLPHPVALTWDHQGLRPLAQTERLLPADDSRAAVDERFFAIATDLLGTPTELVDESGGLAWHTRTTLWGTTTWAKTSTAYTPLRFPGQYYDPETGLHYNLHRHYDPQTARYLTPDPLGLAPAPNPVAYVHNPHTWADPLGLSPYRPGPPQGVSPEDFGEAGRMLREGTGHLGDDVVVQGSRAAGTARPTSDIDFAIRVDSDRFDQLIRERFGTPNPDSAKERTMLHAMETGKIQAGEAGLRSLRKALEAQLGMDVDLSVIRRGGPFDNPPFVRIP